MALEVAVIGDALLDVALAPVEPMRPGGDVRGTVRVGPGGQGANVAVRLARRGARVRLACGLGADAAGNLVRGALEAEGVRVDSAPVAATGVVAILLDHGGERSMLSQRQPFLADVDPGAIVGDADWLVISGYALTEEAARPFARGAAETSPRRAILGCTVPAAAIQGWRSAAATVRPHLLILNADEAGALASGHGETLAAAIAGEMSTLTVVTGPAEAYAAGHDLRLTASPGNERSGVIDTTGAGDAFAAALIAALGGEWPPHEASLRAALAAALAAAAEVVRIPGAQGRTAAEGGQAPQ